MDAAPPTPQTTVRGARRWLRGAVLATAAGGLLYAPVASQGDLQGTLAQRSAAAGSLRAAIAAQTAQIQTTTAGLQVAERRLGVLQAQAAARQAELDAVLQGLVAARDRLTALENKLHRASTALAANLVASYEGDAPDLVTVVLEAHGFADLLDRVDFLKTVAVHDADIVRNAKVARTQVVGQTVRLEGLETRDRALTAAVVNARNTASAFQDALLRRQADLLRGRAGARAQLSQVTGQIAALDHQIAQAQARTFATSPVSGSVAGSLPIDAGGMAQAPAGAPASVSEVIAAGNAIAGLPYLYGGGHASFRANAYDCSGSVSYALAAAGLVSSPLDSTAFESWGQPGPGRWITVYANAGHAFMVVAGWRFDTVALAQDGTRWTQTMTDTGGFVARHPAGL
jgi:cell wall-associated NlpC family hydrolase